jgi:hypothetical protein
VAVVGKLEEGLTRICTDDADFKTDNGLLARFAEVPR